MEVNLAREHIGQLTSDAVGQASFVRCRIQGRSHGAACHAHAGSQGGCVGADAELVVAAARDDHALELSVVFVFEPACGECEQLLLLIGFDRNVATRAVEQSLTSLRGFANESGRSGIDQTQAAQQTFGGVTATGDVVAVEPECLLLESGDLGF